MRNGTKSLPNGWIKKEGNYITTHIEAEGCIVNVYEGLTNDMGKKVTAVEIIPDDYADEKWMLDGHRNNRVIQKL